MVDVTNYLISDTNRFHLVTFLKVSKFGNAAKSPGKTRYNHDYKHFYTQAGGHDYLRNLVNVSEYGETRAYLIKNRCYATTKLYRNARDDYGNGSRLIINQTRETVR